MGGTGSREVADGTESPLRVSLGFEPAWYSERCEVDFSERWHKDPVYRYRSLKKMKAELTRRFPQVSYWNEAYEDDLATLSGCFGIYVIPAVFGFSLRYTVDRWPLLEPGRHISVDEMERLDVKKLLEGSFVEALFNQMDIIESHWGKIHGYLHFQGILNNAFHMRGQDIFLDMIDRPDLAHQFFSIICDVMIELARKVQARQRQTGFPIDFLTVSNCTLNMISPEMYREFVFPYDNQIARRFERFGIHTCNWNIDPYIDAFRELPKLGYLDMGMESDLPSVKETFPETRRAVLYWPTKLVDAPLAEIRKDMAKVYGELAPCDVAMADMQASTPDARVIDFLNICHTLESNGIA
jgi:uroporphyrinogen-III decarboxylase